MDKMAPAFVLWFVFFRGSIESVTIRVPATAPLFQTGTAAAGSRFRAVALRRLDMA